MGILDFFKGRRQRLLLGQGIPLNELGLANPNLQKVFIPDEIRNGHWMSFGGSRTGKSRLLIHALREGIRKNRDIIVIDPKFDADLYPCIYQAAQKARRLDQLIYIDAVHPDKSLQINPFSSWAVADEIIENVLAAIPPSNESFFREQAKKVATVGINFANWESKCAHGRPAQFSIGKLCECLSYDWLQKRYNQFATVPGEPFEDWQTIMSLAKGVLDPGPLHFEKVSSNLTNALNTIGTGVVRRCIDTNDNVLLKRLEEGTGLIAYIYPGGMIAREGAYILCRMLFSMLQNFIGRVYAEFPGGKLPRTLEIHADEASGIFYPGIEHLFNKAGGADCWLHFLTQSLADIDSSIGEARRSVILDSSATKVFLACGDAEKSGRYVANLAGNRKRLDFTTRAGGGSGSVHSYREVESPIIDNSKLTKLKFKQFFLFARNHGNFIGQLQDIPGKDQ